MPDEAEPTFRPNGQLSPARSEVEQARDAIGLRGRGARKRHDGRRDGNRVETGGAGYLVDLRDPFARDGDKEHCRDFGRVRFGRIVQGEVARVEREVTLGPGSENTGDRLRVGRRHAFFLRQHPLRRDAEDGAPRGKALLLQPLPQAPSQWGWVGQERSLWKAELGGAGHPAAAVRCANFRHERGALLQCDAEDFSRPQHFGPPLLIRGRKALQPKRRRFAAWT